MFKDREGIFPVLIQRHYFQSRDSVVNGDYRINLSFYSISVNCWFIITICFIVKILTFVYKAVKKIHNIK